MNFLWPDFLWTLAVLPVLVVLYLLLLRRRRRNVVRLPSVSIVRQAIGRGPGWRRHVPPALLLAALAVLLLATARPAAVVRLPSQQQTIMLAMDVSGSMRATDVQPTRLRAAQDAAEAFLRDLPRHVRVGIVAFAGTAAVVQAPTTNRDDLLSAIERFQLQRATAIGSGIVLSLATLFPDAGIDLSQITGQKPMPDASPEKKTTEKPFAPVEPGSYSSAAIILLTDGQRTTGPDPVDAAKMAADRGIKIFTVGIGTVNGEVIGFEGWSMRVRLDEDTLKSIAGITRAQYYYAGTAEDLKHVYEGLSSRLVVETKETEITAFFAAAGALLVVLAAALSLWWFGRVA